MYMPCLNMLHINYQDTVGVKKRFQFRSVSLSFRSLLKRRSFTVGIRSVPFRIVAVHSVCTRDVIHEMRRPHCEDLSSSTSVGTAFSLFRVCAKKKSFFVPRYIASLYRVCGGRVTRNSQLNGNGTIVNGKRKEMEQNWKKCWDSYCNPMWCFFLRNVLFLVLFKTHVQ